MKKLFTFFFGILVFLSFFTTPANAAGGVRTFPTGSFIINMGVSPQTVANALRPYGMVYDLVANYKVPVYWIIDSTKAKDGVDFTFQGVNFRTGAFVIPNEFRTAAVNARISYWTGLNVVGITTTSPLTINYFEVIKTVPRWTLDQKNGSIAQGYLNNMMIPATSYNFKDPQLLNCCDDLFAMPHADPTWPTHSNLFTWNNTCKGGIWAACHAGSAQENLINPSNSAQQMNFLTIRNNSTTRVLNNVYTQNSLILWTNHAAGSPPYITRLPGDPVQQYLGVIDAATQNGSEQIFIPVQDGVARWRPGAKVLVYDPTQSNVPSLQPDLRNAAAVMVYGRAFDDPNRGYVMYEAGHSHNKGTAGDIAAQRAFVNFSYFQQFERAPVISAATAPPSLMSAVQGPYSMSVTATSPFGLPLLYQWTSGCGGTFSNPTSASTNFTPPAVVGSSPCIISVEVKDNCGRAITESFGVVINQGPQRPDANPDTLLISSDCGPGSPTNINVGSNDTDGDTPNNQLTWSFIGSGTGGTWQNLGGGVFRYTPSDNFSGTAIQQYRVCDNTTPTALCDTTFAVINVGSTDLNGCLSNEVFIWNGGYQYITAQNTVSGTINNGANITGAPDGAVTLIGNNSAGVIRVQLGATPAPAGRIFTMTWQSGDANVSRVSIERSTDGTTWTTDPGILSTVATHSALQSINFTLSGPANWLRITRNANRPRIDAIGFQTFSCASRVPTAVNDVLSIAEDVPGTVSVLANDTDPSGSILTTKRIVSQPKRGIASVNLNNTITYINNQDVSGLDTLTYEVCNTEGYCVTASLYITITDDQCPAGQYQTAPGTSTFQNATHTADNIIYTGDTDKNYGACDYSDIGYDGTPIGRYVSRYTLPTLPGGSTVTSAILTMKLEKQAGSTQNLDLYRLTTAFTEGGGGCGGTDNTASSWIEATATVDWSTPGGDFTGNPGSTPYASVTVIDNTANGTLFNWNVTTLVNQWYANTFPNNGFLIRGPETAGLTSIDFHSKEAAAADRPVLRVNYTTAPTCGTIINRAPLAQNDFATVSSSDSIWVKPMINDIDPNTGNTKSISTIISTTNATATISGDSIKLKASPLGFNGLAQIRYRVVDNLGAADTAIIYLTCTNASPIANADFYTDSSGVTFTNSVKSNDVDPEGDTLSAPVITLAPINGEATVIGNQIRYIPNPEFTGKDTLIYRVCETIFNSNDCDPVILCDTARVVYTMLNRRPRVTPNLNVIVTPCQENIFNILSDTLAYGIKDPEKGELNITVTRNPTKGTYTLGNGQQITYTPNVGQTTGFDTIRFVVSDNGVPPLTSDTITLRLAIVTPVNLRPIAVNDFDQVNIGEPWYSSVLDNDSDPENDPMVVSRPVGLLNPKKGTAVVLINGLIEYTPFPGAYGLDSLDYLLCDVRPDYPTCITDTVGCDTARLYLDINVVNTTVAINDQQSTWINLPVSGNVMTNDYDPEGNIQNFNAFLSQIDGVTPITSGSTVSGVDSAGNPFVNAGTITFNSSGQYTYTPANNFVGYISVEYFICDDSIIQACDTATLTITVNPYANIENSVIATNDEYVTLNENPITNKNILVNDADPQGDNFVVTAYRYDSDGDGSPDTSGILGDTIIVGGVSSTNLPTDSAGKYILYPDGSFTFIPIKFFTGTVDMFYDICDNGVPVACASAPIRIHVTTDANGPFNDPPFAGDDLINTNVNQPKLGNFFANDSDPNFDSVRVAGFTINTSGPATPIDTLTTAEGGTVIFYKNGTYLYTPPVGFIGSDKVVYEICDKTVINPQPLCASATIYQIVGAPNRTYAINDEHSTYSGVAIGGNVVNNDYDPEAHDINFGNFLNQNTGAPIASGSTLSGINLQGNPVASAGQITFDANGNYTFTPAIDFVGKVTVPYSICDEGHPVSCDTALLTIVVASPAEICKNCLVANNDEYLTFGTAVTDNLTRNDADPNFNNFAVTTYQFDSNGDGVLDASGSLATPTNIGGVNMYGNAVSNAGSFVLNSSGVFTFTPAAGFYGEVKVQYTICDDYVPTLCVNATWQTNVIVDGDNSFNNPPQANDDFRFTYANTPVQGNFIANDTDPNGNPVRLNGFTINTGSPLTPIDTLTTVQNGTVVFFQNGTYSYTPPSNYIGPDQVNYTICDVSGFSPQPLCATAMIHFLTGLENTTVASHDENTTFINLPASGNVIDNDYDPEGNGKVFKGFTNNGSPISSGNTVSGIDRNGNPVSNAGTLTFDTLGNYTYTPSPGFTGSISVPYGMCDNGSPIACDSALLQIQVLPLATDSNSIIANNDEYFGLRDQNISSQLFVNDADPQFEAFSLTSFRYDSNGDGIIESTGNLSVPVNVAGITLGGTPFVNAGQLTVNADGTFTFDPDSNFTGEIRFDYTICDVGSPQACATALVRIHIVADINGPLNNPPYPADDFAYTSMNTPVTGNFIGNDYDPNGDSITMNGVIINVSGPANLIQTVPTAEGGTVAFYSNGTFIYIPPTGYIGPDRLTYTICDTTTIQPQPLCEPAFIHLLVSQIQDNTTVAINDEQSTFSNTPVNGNVVTNDYDNEDHVQNFGSFLDSNGNSISSGATVPGVTYGGSPVANAGTITFDGNGNYVFTPADGFTGTVSIPYTICDEGYPTACDTAVLTVTVNPFPTQANSIIANNDEYISFGNPVNGNVKLNDADPNGDAFSVTQYAYDSNGDGTADATTAPGTPQIVAGIDEDGNSVLNAGTLTLNSNGTFTFVPQSGFSGQVQVVYTACDVIIPPACAQAVLKIDVIIDNNGALNNPPIAGDDFSYTFANTPVTGNFISNDSDPNGDALSVNGFTINPAGPATPIDTLTTSEGGTIVFLSNGTYQYTPPTGYVGPDQLIYTVCDVTNVDPQPLCASATIHLLVGSVNTTIATNDENSTYSGMTVGGNVTLNDYDAEGHTQTFGSFLNQADSTVATSPMILSGFNLAGNFVANTGTLTFDANGNYTYVPNADFVGKSTVPYTICDNGYPVVCDTAVLTIVTASPPALCQNCLVANNDEYITFGATANGNITLNDADPNLNAYTVSSYLFDNNGDGIPNASGTVGSPVAIGGMNVFGNPVANAGTITINSNGTFTFVPQSGFNGQVELQYTICDNAPVPLCVNAQVTIHVVADPDGIAFNNPPYAGDDFVFTFQDIPAASSFVANDNDPNGNPISLNGITINTAGPATPIDTLTTIEGGQVIFRANGTYTYTPPVGHIGPDRVIYTICDVTAVDPQPLCAEAMIHMLVSVPNNTIANLDENTTFNDLPVSGNVITNDYDPESNNQIFGSFLSQADSSDINTGATLSGYDVDSNFVANAGTLTFDASGNYTFTPADGFIGSVSVPYSVCDDGFPTACDTTLLQIQVLPWPFDANSIIANNDEYTTFDSPIVGNVKLNDADPQGHPFNVTGYTYDSDGDGLQDAFGTLSTPIVVGGFTELGTPISNAGTLVLNSDGSFVFTPTPGFKGQVDAFYTICDNQSPQACATAILNIDVLSDGNGLFNDPPQAGDDFSYTSINTTVSGNFIANDSDLNNDSINVNGITINPVGPATPVDTLTTVAGGTVILFANGTYNYIPPTGFTGPDRVNYTICDVTIVEPQPLCSSAMIHLLVGTDNTTNAVNDENSTFAGIPASGNVVTNDYDLEGHTQDFGSFLNPTQTGSITSGSTVSGTDPDGNPVGTAGTLTFDGNGNYTFTPAPGFTGVAIIPYNICDNGYPTECDTAILEITVSPQPFNANSLIANNDEYTIFGGTTLNSNVKLNDADPQGDAFNVTSFKYYNNGDGTPNASGTVGSPVNVGGVRNDGTPLSNAGSLTLNSDGTFTFTPVAGFIGTVSLEYEVCDVAIPVACAAATITIDVLGDDNGQQNNPPVAGDDFSYTNINIPVTDNFIGNDYDLNGDPVSVNGTTINTGGPATPVDTLTTIEGGTVVIRANGTYVYTPPIGYTGPDRVVYEICDVTNIQPEPLCAQATIHLLVGTNNTTYAVNDENSTWVNTPASGDVTTNDYDIEGHTQTFGSFLNQINSSTLTSGSIVRGTDPNGSPVLNAGTLTFLGDGTYTYTPATGFVGTVSVPYSICDNGYPSICDTAYLEITVSPLPTTANSVIANNDEYSTYGDPVSGDLSLNDADPQGDNFNVISYLFDNNGDGIPSASGSVGSPVSIGGIRIDGTPVTNAGSLTLNSDGTFTFTPVNEFIGEVTLTYTIEDDAAVPATSTATVVINVLGDPNGPVNDPPVAGDDFIYTAVNVIKTGNFTGNDLDLNGDPISVNGTTINTGGPSTPVDTLTTAQGGTVILRANGTYTYIPATNYVGPDYVVYEICDVTVIEPQPLCTQATIHMLVGSGVVIEGLVWHDFDGSITLNGAETGTTANSSLYINVSDASGRVVAVSQVNTNGTYTINNVPSYNSLTATLSTTPGTIGQPSPAASLPAGWVNTGQNFDGDIITAPLGIIDFPTTNDTIKNLDFGIELIPTAQDFYTNLVYYIIIDSAGNIDTTQLNYLEVLPSYFITDDVDGTVDSVRLTTFPQNVVRVNVNGQSYTSSTWPEAGIMLPTDTAGQPIYTNFWVYPDTTAQPNIIIPFRPKDNARQMGNQAIITLGYNSVLPVELISFEAVKNGCQVELNWVTASEMNNDVFIVHRSLDAINWQAIGTVKGNGTTPLPSSYTFTDVEPIPTTIYYRLLQRDYDGANEWLPIRSVDMSQCGTAEARVYPIPAKNVLYLEMASVPLRDAWIAVYSSKGDLVMREQMAGTNRQQMDVSKLAAGSYILEWSDGVSRSTFKVIITR